MGPKASAKWRDLGRRSLSAAVLVPVVLAAVWAGGVWFTFLVALTGVAIAYEWTSIVHERDAPQFALHAAAAISGALLPPEAGIAAAVAVLAVLTLLGILVGRPGEAAGPWRFIGIAYVGLPAIALTVLRADPLLGRQAVFWLLAVVWASDIAAYFAGRLLGGAKLAPVISPNKTWAGALGGLAGGALAGALAGHLLVDAALVPGLIAIAISITAQSGDLFKSVLKRRYGLKDSGNLIPGHGGMIDRVDGLVAAAVAAAVIGIAHAGADGAGRGLLAW